MREDCVVCWNVRYREETWCGVDMALSEAGSDTNIRILDVAVGCSFCHRSRLSV
jgi:hypothetical protein